MDQGEPTPANSEGSVKTDFSFLEIPIPPRQPRPLDEEEQHCFFASSSRQPSTGEMNITSAFSGEGDAVIREEESTSADSSSSESDSPVDPSSTAGDEKARRKKKKQADMLQLAMEAISTFKASRKRSCKESSHHASTKKLAPHHPISSKIDSTDLEPSHFMDPKDDTKKADFVHPLMREMLFPRRDVPDYSLLPLPFPPTKALQTTPEVDYFEEGSSSGDEYDPDDLAGEAAYKCEMCLLVFDEQADADAHMASDRHRNALNLMMLTAVNYATDIDVIVKLRRKMLGMGKVAVAADRARRKNPSSATTMEVAEYESELERLEKECTERGLSGLQELDTAFGNEVQMVHASTDKTADETTRRKGLRKRRPHRKTKVPVGVVV